MFTKPKRPIGRVFVHCSASDVPSHDDISVIDRWHKQNGWSQVGYHFFITKRGVLQAGRSLELTPAAQGGHNAGTIAICLHGLKVELFTKAQFATLRDLCHEINEAYRGSVTFHGHCEVSAKACPVFDYRRVLELDSRGRLGMGKAQMKEADADLAVEFGTSLQRGDRGPAVSELQNRLNQLLIAQSSVREMRASPWSPSEMEPLRIDGDFGPRTEAAVKAFQRAHHLVPDGIVGPLTREMLRG